VYVQTNAAAGNQVLAFERGHDGRLGPAISYPTGGTGTGSGLGNQGGVVMSPNGKWLFVVNAGSNDVSVFRAGQRGLRLAGRSGSGGVRPVSVAVRGDLVFVLNAGGEGNVTGFRLRESGRLQPLRHATRPLSAPDAMAAQVSFAPDGEHLVVTERATHRITVFTLGGDHDRGGALRGPYPQASSGMTPFGFGFDRRGTLIVSEAFGGAAGASAVSSYRLGHRGTLRVVSGSVPTTETSACWLAVSADDRFAYAANTGSGTVTGYRIGSHGALTRLDPDGVTGTAGMAPADLAFGGRYLYVRNGGSASISAFRWKHDGSLESIGETSGLPIGASGLAAN
jgi:6-phosphogluconolactonase (cycloisomerase 2 family)